MTPEVFRVMLRMQIKPGMEDGFERVWLRIGDSVTGHPANLGQWLSRSAEEPGVYYIVSDWVDEARFREFEHSDGHLVHRQRLHPFRSAGSMTTMHVVAHLPGAAVPPVAGAPAVPPVAGAPAVPPVAGAPAVLRDGAAR